jgi:murein DD-endopeptidase MepM/ murein hydrolase activator NlpD
VLFKAVWFLGALGLSIGCGPRYWSAAKIVPTDAAPGDTLHVTVDTAVSVQKLSIEFAGRRYPLFANSPNRVHTRIGLHGEWPPAAYDVTLRRGGWFRSPVVIGTVHVSIPTFSTEYITMPAEKTKLPTGPEFEDARIKFAAYLATVTPVSLLEGEFKTPVARRVTAVFGTRRWINKTIAYPYHKGLDIGAPLGTAVKAGNTGRVLAVVRFPVQGRMVILDHGQGVLSVYMHLSATLVEPGQIVRRGRPVGKVGSDGFSTGPHLHWGIYVFGEPVNPEPWLKAAR